MTPTDLSRHIPPEVVDAAAHAIFAHPSDPIDWEVARAALAAGLAAWPHIELDEAMWKDGPNFLILPLPQEGGE